MRIEETETKVGSRINKTVSSLNSKILGPSASDFKYKSSINNIAQINRIRELTLDAFSELEENFGVGFEDLTGAKALQAVLDELEDQEESIKIAEAFPPDTS